MKKYLVLEGMNSFESNSRNVRKHMRDGGYDKVTVLLAKDKSFVCEGKKNHDNTISIRTVPNEFEK